MDHRLLVLAAVVCALPAVAPARAFARSSCPKVALRVGEAMEFAAAPDDASGAWQWTLDDRPVATARRWTFTPGLDAVGTHRVRVATLAPGERRAQTWAVRVRPPRPPRIVDGVPAAATIDLPADGHTELAIRTAPAAAGDDLQVQWTVDGTPAGDGERLHVEATRAGTMRVRALVTSRFGGAAAREWLIVVAPPPTVVVASPAPPPTVPPAVVPTTTHTTALAAVPTTSLPARPAEPAPPVAVARRAEPSPSADALSAAELRAFLERYAAAWRSRDVDALARIGQVTNDRQAAALRSYFAGVQDFDVQVDVLDVRVAGDRGVVRFTRRDRFRNPGGEVVTKESPPIEKEVVRTPGGLRFAPQAP